MSLPRRTVASLLVVVLLSAGGVAGSVEPEPLTARFDPGDIVVDDDPVRTTLVVGNATGEVTVSAEGLDAATVARMVDGSATAEGAAVAVPPDGRVPVTVPTALGCRPGEYEFRVTGRNDTATATLSVGATPTPPVALEEGAVTVRRGETADIGVRLGRCLEGAATLVVGGNDSPLQANVSLVANGTGGADGTVTLDTGATTFDATGSVVLRSVAVAARPADGTLPPGTYPLSLQAGGETFGVGTLKVVAPTTTPTPDSTATLTTTPTPGTSGFSIVVATAAVVLAGLALSRRA